MTQFSLFAEATEGEQQPAGLLILVYFFGLVLLCYSFISFNRLLPNLHQHDEKELGLGKRSRRRLSSLWWALPRKPMVTKGGTRRCAGCAVICLWIASGALQGRGDCEECGEPWLRQTGVISSAFQRHCINQYCFVDHLALHFFFSFFFSWGNI